MAGQICKMIFLVAAFAVLSYSLEPEEYGTTKIGQNCERDRNCIKHAFCRVQRTCLCEPYYSPTYDKTMCIATSGLFCENDETCSSMANAECKQGQCACKETFILDVKNSSNCISRPMRVGDRCQRNGECEDAFDRAMCINDKCQCITGHHFVNETEKCIQSRALYNFCTADYECYLDENNPDSLQCKNGECVCKEGEPSCSKGSSYAALGILVAILLFLPRLI